MFARHLTRSEKFFFFFSIQMPRNVRFCDQFAVAANLIGSPVFARDIYPAKMHGDACNFQWKREREREKEPRRQRDLKVKPRLVAPHAVGQSTVRAQWLNLNQTCTSI